MNSDGLPPTGAFSVWIEFIGIPDKRIDVCYLGKQERKKVSYLVGQ